MAFVGITFDIGIATYSSHDPDGYPLTQHDAMGKGAGVGAYHTHHTFGFISRARDPDCDKDGKPLPGKACNLRIGKIGSEVHHWLEYDPRFIPLIPQLKKGGSGWYCATGAFSVFDGENGTQTTYVPIPGDKAHVVTIGLDGNQKPFIGIEQANGLAITMLEKSIVLKNASGSVYLEMNDDGFIFNGNEVHNGGATFGSPAGAQPVALSPAVLAWMNALEELTSKSFLAIGAALLANGTTAQAAFDLGRSTVLAGIKAGIAAQKTSAA